MKNKRVISAFFQSREGRDKEKKVGAREGLLACVEKVELSSIKEIN